MSRGTELRAALRSVFLEMGRALTVTRAAPGTYDSETGTASAGTPATYSGIGRVGDYRDSAIDGTLIQVGDRRVTWQPDDASFVPQIGDTISVDGRDRPVMSVKTRELEGDWIAFTLQVR